MKYCIIIIDGAADNPSPELAGNTPLEKAVQPALTALTKTGELGTVMTVPEGYSPGSDVAIMSLLGNDPALYYTGRSPIEAAARDIPVGPSEWVFRCNLVTINEGIMRDHSAGNIPSEQAAQLIEEINHRLGSKECRFYPGVSYRNLLVCSRAFNVTTTPPHDILDQPIYNHFPTGDGASMLTELINSSSPLLAAHPVNLERRSKGLAPANSIWFWGEGTLPAFPSFRERFGLQGAVISAVDLVHGLGKLMGWDLLHVEGATGYMDTNYAGKGKKAIEALAAYDLVCIHIEAPDEAGHAGDVQEKILALENIDKHITGPVSEFLRGREEDWRVLIMPDHPTPCAIRTHTREAVPYLIAGSGVRSSGAAEFSEKSARKTGLHVPHGHELILRLLQTGLSAHGRI